MMIVKYSNRFQTAFLKIRDNLMKEKVTKQIIKLKNNPKVGKPMMYERKGTREVYLKPLRFSYSYSVEEDKITLLDIYHKRKQ